tara:strand:+ start:685 stop:1425 length:741 start_codon:yes stop_codon:yes gene_type:complete
MKKTALVTGAIGGIGTSICKRLIKDGCLVIGTYRLENKERAMVWQAELSKEGYECYIYPVDVSDYSSCSNLIEQIKSEFGSVDILINNAGVTSDATIGNMTVEMWQSVINTNLNSVFNLSKLVFEIMSECNFGRIINISSINGQKGQFGQANYAASKSGIYGLTKSLALEGARKGVTVNSISPGYIATEMLVAMPEKILNKIINDIPVGRLGLPEEVAEAVSYLASDKAGFVTGSNLAINGGQHMC